MQDRNIHGSAFDRLARAKSDLAMARLPSPEEAYLEDLCFHAQQEGEKALKAMYRLHGWDFRYTHDLDELISGLRKKGCIVPDELDDTIILSSYAWESRYPGFGEPVQEEEYLVALTHATALVNWVENQIRK